MASFDRDLCRSDFILVGDNFLKIGFTISVSSIMSVLSLPSPRPVRTMSNSFLKFLRTKFSFYLLFSFNRASLSFCFSESYRPNRISLIFSFFTVFEKFPFVGESTLLDLFEYINEEVGPVFLTGLFNIEKLVFFSEIAEF